MLWFLLITPGVIVAYALILRPLLHKIPALKAFYDQADTFWGKVWALCGKSLTIAWGFVLGGIGSAFSLVDQLGAALGDPSLNLKQQVMDTLKDHPEYLGYILTGISAITITARVRSLMKPKA
jgi:hypothetical protein